MRLEVRLQHFQSNTSNKEEELERHVLKLEKRLEKALDEKSEAVNSLCDQR